MTHSAGEADPSPVDYRQTFIGHIRRGLDRGLVCLADRVATVSEQQRRQYGQLLRYGLQEPASAVTACQLLLALSPHMAHASVRDEWSTLLTTGWQAAQAAGEPATALRIAVELGELSRQMGKLNEAEGWLAQAWALRQPHDDPALIGRILHRRAYLFSQRGDRVEALYLAEEAVRLLAPGTAEWAMAQFTLGVVLIRLHKLGSAEEHLKIASETWVVLEYRFEYALCIQNLGRVARISGDWGKAHSLYLEACTVLEELERDHDRSIVILNIGANFVEQKKCDEALRLFYAVVPVFRNYKDMRNLAMTWNNIGMALTEMEEWERALEALVESVRLWSSLISVKDRINTQDNLCIVLLHLQRADEARKILEEALIDLSTTYQDDDYFYLKSVIEQHLTEANERLN